MGNTCPYKHDPTNANTENPETQDDTAAQVGRAQGQAATQNQQANAAFQIERQQNEEQKEKQQVPGPSTNIGDQPQDETAKLKKLHSGVSLKEALVGYRFWVLAIGILLVAISISGVITNLVPLLTDRGLSVSQAASYAGLIGLSVIGGRVIAGFLMDHLWAPLIAAIFLGMPCLAAVLLTGESLTPLTISLSVLIIGLAAGAELDLMAFLVSRYFGLKNYGGLYGGIYIFFSLGAGLAPALFGLAFDSFGNYQMTLNVVAVTSLMGAALMLTLGRYPKFN